MAKQIKLGFSQVPSPSILDFEPLLDILTGEQLTDARGEPIFTEVLKETLLFSTSEKALSVYWNNDKKQNEIAPVQVLEEFAQTSEVSTTLLGVERAETQLSLFSDVSTYGLNEDDWEFFRFNNAIEFPIEWYRRKHPFYEKRNSIELYEGSNEQALYIQGFPVNYDFPYGPKWENRRFNAIAFTRYLKFVLAGKQLYNFYVNKANYENFAKRNFLSDAISIVNLQGDVQNISALDYDDFNFENPSYDVSYDNFEESFFEIEKFTIAFFEISQGRFEFPETGLSSSQIAELEQIVGNIESNIGEMRPGYERGNDFFFGTLQSKQTFRYQPGRISGFTFGARMKTNFNTSDNFIEWGCTNDSDQYVFQIKGAEFNIVRRSTVRLDNSVLEDQGIDPNSQIQIFPSQLENSNPLWETVISRDKFNGDSLDGNGPSGYIFSYENVTMFKIEFGWYGAIGAKFYAYIPFDNNGARWVLLHTLIIENKLGKPCLQNPNFRFTYFLGITDKRNIFEPVYVYKYGSSYYIDGGDEGNPKIYSFSSNEKEYSILTPSLGILPKNTILSSNKDSPNKNIPNRKEIYPEKISVITNEFSEVSCYEVTGSPSGHHFYYSPSLENVKNSSTKEIQLTISNDGQTAIANSSDVSSDDAGKKLIGDGIYNLYFDDDEDFGDVDAISISRRFRYDKETISSAENALLEKTTLTDNSIVDLRGNTFTVKVVDYELVAAQNSISSNHFKVHFLNPIKRDEDTGKNFAEFFIGVTYKEPKLDGSNNLVFGDLDENLDTSGDSDDLIKEEWSHFSNRLNIEGNQNSEDSEWDPSYGIKMIVDPRLENPLGDYSGEISAINFFVNDVEISDISISGNEVTISSFPGGVNFDLFQENVTEVGFETGAPILVVSKTITQNQQGQDEFKLTLNSSPPQGTTSIFVKSITIRDDFSVDSFELDGNPRFTEKIINKTKILKYDIQPLYIVVGLMDYAQINNIVIEEINEQSSKTFSPNFVQSSNLSSILKTNNGSNSNLSPSNFLSAERLSGIRYDVETTQPLRPGKKIFSFFTEPNVTKQIGIENIFSPDRKKLTSGTFNNKALFFAAEQISSNTGAGSIETSITLREL